MESARHIMMNSKGFRMRRDHEAKQELGIQTEEDRQRTHAERPLDQQQRPAAPVAPKPSLLTRVWRQIAG